MKAFRILLVEDNPGDADLIREILSEGAHNLDIACVQDGAEALDRLNRGPPGATRELPDLIFLDLNLPKLDGRDVLAEIKGDETLRRIPVVILTSSDAEQDIARCYDLGANCYVTKPVGLEAFQAAVGAAALFWLVTAEVP